MRLVWTEPALEDLEAIYAFIARDDPKPAVQVLTRIYDTVETHLPSSPHIGRPGRVADTRELVIAGLPFIAPYRVKGGTIQVLRVLHGARGWPEAF